MYCCNHRRTCTPCCSCCFCFCFLPFFLDGLGVSAAVSAAASFVLLLLVAAVFCFPRGGEGAGCCSLLRFIILSSSSLQTYCHLYGQLGGCVLPLSKWSVCVCLGVSICLSVLCVGVLPRGNEENRRQV